MSRVGGRALGVSLLLLLTGCAAGGDIDRGPVSRDEWRPSDPIEFPARMSEPDRRTERDRVLTELAESAQIADQVPPPEDLPVERWRTSDEGFEVIQQCMAESGWKLELGPGGSLGGSYPTSQESAYQVDRYMCEARFPGPPEVDRPLNESQLRAVYDYRIRVLIPCLEARGILVSDPPSEEVFIASYPGEWNPFSDSAVANHPEVEELQSLCPQTPPGYLLYGV